jgi:hypothetical protein
MKPDTEFFYDLRHLMQFRELSKNEDCVWLYRWPDGGDIEVYRSIDGKTMFTLGHDARLAEYICDLHNLSKRMISFIKE